MTWRDVTFRRVACKQGRNNFRTNIKKGVKHDWSSQLSVLKQKYELLQQYVENYAEKIDKLCTYLENNGPAALHVADGKDVDLNLIYREVIG